VALLIPDLVGETCAFRKHRCDRHEFYSDIEADNVTSMRLCQIARGPSDAGAHGKRPFRSSDFSETHDRMAPAGTEFIDRCRIVGVAPARGVLAE